MCQLETICGIKLCVSLRLPGTLMLGTMCHSLCDIKMFKSVFLVQLLCLIDTPLTHATVAAILCTVHKIHGGLAAQAETDNNTLPQC